MRPTLAFLTAFAVAACAAAFHPGDARADGVSIADWIGSVPGQFGGATGQSAEADYEAPTQPLSISAGLRLFIFARTIHAFHVSGRPRAWSFPFQHSQTEQDSSWFVIHRVGALALTGDYALNKDMKVRAAVLLGAMAATLEYRVGSGNPNFGGNTDYSVVLDTDTGYYPLDMFYGLDLEGTYSMGEFQAGAKLLTHVASAPFEESAMLWGVVEGWVYYFAFDAEAFAAYKTKYGTPWAGLGLSFYRGWSHQETVADGTPEDYMFNFREEMPFTFVGGYRVDLEKGHYIALDFAMIGKWSFGIEVGLKVM